MPSLNPVSIVLVLILAVVVSGPLARAARVVPLPLVQIAIGAALASFAGVHLALQPELFFLLFLPPLLFLDGWRIPKDSLRGNRRTILALAFGLVVFTVLGLGVFIHAILPAMPLSVAFALAAVLSPTDPVAVSAITARLPMPKRLMHVLEGEALLNDASGLVCMRLAAAATLSGTFHLWEAGATFLWLVAAGLGTGIAVTVGASWLRYVVHRRIGDEPGTSVLHSLLIPFGAFLLAEHLDGSGVLAAAAAGITMARVELGGHTEALTRIRRMAVWDAIGFAANGAVFVLLGLQLPRVLVEGLSLSREAGHGLSGWLVGHVLAITAALVALRFFWVWVMLRISRRGARRASKRVVAVAAVAGVRGAVTLAGVLSLPFALPDGSPFPARDLAIVLAAGVIIASLVTASALLPMLVRRLELEEEHDGEAQRLARLAATEAALARIEAHTAARGEADDTMARAEAAERLAELYRRRLAQHDATGEELERAREEARQERDLRLDALRAERDAVYALARSRKLSDLAARTLVLELDLAEAHLLAIDP